MVKGVIQFNYLVRKKLQQPHLFVYIGVNYQEGVSEPNGEFDCLAYLAIMKMLVIPLKRGNDPKRHIITARIEYFTRRPRELFLYSTSSKFYIL